MTRAEIEIRLNEIYEELAELDEWSFPWLKEDLEAEADQLIWEDAE